MSTVYVLEPPTKGKVVINTTRGPLDIELWPKEAPKAVRNFVQLCMEGYYDNTIFHRIIKDFLVQGGDPTGTGTAYKQSFTGEFVEDYCCTTKIIC
ncbi:cytochrome P450 monooxygenase 57, partial [Stylosanthes scabra]|nr:cytochrome P450 monooxygenase 57 [Stylosanthes scabra]